MASAHSLESLNSFFKNDLSFTQTSLNKINDSFDESSGILTRNKRKLRVKALPGNLPDSLNVDISELELGDKFYTSELESDDYELLHPDNTVVCQVRTSRASMASVSYTHLTLPTKA